MKCSALLVILATSVLASTALGDCPSSSSAGSTFTTLVAIGSAGTYTHTFSDADPAEVSYYCPVGGHCTSGNMNFNVNVVPRMAGTPNKTINIVWAYQTTPGFYANLAVSPGDQMTISWTGSEHGLSMITPPPLPVVIAPACSPVCNMFCVLGKQCGCVVSDVTGLTCCTCVPIPVVTPPPKPLVFKARCLGTNEIPNKVITKTKAQATVTVYNNSYATGSWTIMSAKQAFAAHIHKGNATSNGPVLVFGWNSTLGGVPQPITGTFSASFTFNPSSSLVLGDNVTDDLIKGNAYFNVHTVAYPGGEIRGQFKKV